MGTPTVRIFGPRYAGINENETAPVGRNVVARHELQYWYETLLREIEIIQQEEQELKADSDSYKTLVDQGMRDLAPYKRCVTHLKLL